MLVLVEAFGLLFHDTDSLTESPLPQKSPRPLPASAAFDVAEIAKRYLELVAVGHVSTLGKKDLKARRQTE